MKKINIAKIEAAWLSHFKIWGILPMSKFSVFSIMAEWIIEMPFMMYLLLLLCSRQNITEYKVSWLIRMPIIKPSGLWSPFIRLQQCGCIDHS